MNITWPLGILQCQNTGLPLRHITYTNNFFLVPLEEAIRVTSFTYMPWIAFWEIVSIFKSSVSVHSDFILKCHALLGRHLSEVVRVVFESILKVFSWKLKQLLGSIANQQSCGP